MLRKLPFDVHLTMCFRNTVYVPLPPHFDMDKMTLVSFPICVVHVSVPEKKIFNKDCLNYVTCGAKNVLYITAGNRRKIKASSLKLHF